MPTRGLRTAQTGLAVVALFLAFAGESVRNLVGWPIFLGAATVISISYLVIVIQRRKSIAWRSIPVWLIIFLAIAVSSAAWAYSTPNTLLTLWPLVMISISSLGITATLPWADFVRALGTTLRWVLGLSLIFELWVAIIIGHPVYPEWLDTSGDKPAAVYEWSRNLLFEGGPIQGIVGNRNQLGFIALIALIVFCVQLADRTIWRAWGIVWIFIAMGTLALTRSATVILALMAVGIVMVFALWTRSRSPLRRRPIYLAATAVVLLTATAVTFARPALLGLFGKSEDLTGRLNFWANVTELAGQRPVLGWGWLSPWVPWLEPFNNLAIQKGVHYLQAHNVWLDVWLQIGVVGVVALAMLMLGLLWRSWFVGVDRPQWDLDEHRPYSASSLIPLLVTTALLAQSVAESQLVVQFGWALVVILSIYSLNPRRIHGLSR